MIKIVCFILLGNQVENSIFYAYFMIMQALIFAK